MASRHRAILVQPHRPYLPALLLRRTPERPRLGVVALAVALFVGVFALRLAVTSVSDPVLIFNAVPIALLSLEAGSRGGIAGATLAAAFVGLWSLVVNVELSVMGYLTRVSTFFLVGALAGYLAEHLRQARHAQRLLLDLAPESAVALDLDGHVTIANSAAHRLFGYGAHELAGLPVDRLVPDFFSVLRRSLRESRTPDEPLLVTAQSKEGGDVPVRVTVGSLASDAHAILVRFRPGAGMA